MAVFMSPATTWFVDTGSLDLQSTSLAKHPWADAACVLEPGYLGVAESQKLEIWGTRDGSLFSETSVARDLQSMCYSKAAGALAVGFRDGTVHTFEFHSLLRGNEPSSRRYVAHTAHAASVDISPDGTWLASGGWDGNVKLHRPPSMREPVDVSLPGMLFRVEFSPCGRWLAASDRPRVGGAGRLTVFDVATGKRLWSAPCLPRPGETPDPPLFYHLRLSTFDATGDELLVIDLDWSIKARDARTGQVKKTYSIGADSRISHIHAAPDGRSLLVKRPSGESLIVDRMSGERISRASAMCLGAFRTIKGDLWLECDESRNLVLRAAPMGKPVLTLPGAADLVKAAAVSADGRYLAAGSYDRVVYRWNLDRGGLPEKFVGHEEAVLDVRFSPDVRTIISRGMDETVRFWDVATQTQLFMPCPPDERVLSMDLSPKGDLLVCGVQHRTNGRCGLHVYRLGPNRESLPKSFEFLPPDAP